MSTQTAPRRLMAASLSLLLVSCSITRPVVVGPSGPQELTKYVLIIKELPDGQVAHSWEPAKDFNLDPYRELLSRSRAERHIVPVVWQRNCDEEMKKCLSECMGSTVGGNWEHLLQPPSRKLGGKHAECRKRCWPNYEDCNKQNAEDSAKAAELPTIDKAIDWLKNHREEVAVGSVVVIAGVVFVVVTCGGGALILAPALLIVSSDAPSERDSVAVKP
jgi:hypothetical protein